MSASQLELQEILNQDILELREMYEVLEKRIASISEKNTPNQK